MEQELSPLERAAKDIEALTGAVRLMAEQSPEVKEGKISVEDEMKEPSYVLYGQITKCTAAIFRDQGIASTFKHLSEHIGEEATADIMNLIAVCMTQSAHQAVIFYDELLKEELKHEFHRVIEQLNSNTATLQAHDGAVKVFKAAIDKINKKLLIDTIGKPTQE